jgi:hypothetical protein
MVDQATKDALDAWAADNFCKYCGHVGLKIEWRLEAKPLGTFSLAGQQMKVSALEWPWAICPGCKHESKGKV